MSIQEDVRSITLAQEDLIQSLTDILTAVGDKKNPEQYDSMTKDQMEDLSLQYALKMKAEQEKSFKEHYTIFQQASDSEKAVLVGANFGWILNKTYIALNEKEKLTVDPTNIDYNLSKFPEFLWDEKAKSYDLLIVVGNGAKEMSSSNKNGRHTGIPTKHHFKKLFCDASQFKIRDLELLQELRDIADKRQLNKKPSTGYLIDELAPVHMQVIKSLQEQNTDEYAKCKKNADRLVKRLINDFTGDFNPYFKPQSLMPAQEASKLVHYLANKTILKILETSENVLLAKELLLKPLKDLIPRVKVTNCMDVLREHSDDSETFFSNNPTVPSELKEHNIMALGGGDYNLLTRIILNQFSLDFCDFTIDFEKNSNKITLK